MSTTLDDFRDYYRPLKSCCLSEDGAVLVEHAVEVLHFIESEPDAECGAAIVRLDDGRIATFEEWQDYTGHG